HRGLRPGLARCVLAPRIQSAGGEDSQQMADPAADLSHLRRPLAALRTMAGAAAGARSRRAGRGSGHRSIVTEGGSGFDLAGINNAEGAPSFAFFLRRAGTTD